MALFRLEFRKIQMFFDKLQVININIFIYFFMNVKNTYIILMANAKKKHNSHDNLLIF